MNKIHLKTVDFFPKSTTFITLFILPASLNQPEPGGIAIANGRKLAGYFCQFPLGTMHKNIRKFQCLLRCGRNPMCTGVNFRPYEGQGDIGECVTVAPDPNGESLRAADVVNFTKPGWEYYGLTRN